MVHDENNPRFTERKQKEFDGIVLKEGIKPVSISTLSSDANIIRNGYVLVIRNSVTESERFKARWILFGPDDKYHHNTVNDSLMLMRMMYRTTVLTSVSSNKNFGFATQSKNLCSQSHFDALYSHYRNEKQNYLRI